MLSMYENLVRADDYMRSKSETNGWLFWVNQSFFWIFVATWASVLLIDQVALYICLTDGSCTVFIN